MYRRGGEGQGSRISATVLVYSAGGEGKGGWAWGGGEGGRTGWAWVGGGIVAYVLYRSIDYIVTYK